MMGHENPLLVKLIESDETIDLLEMIVIVDRIMRIPFLVKLGYENPMIVKLFKTIVVIASEYVDSMVVDLVKSSRTIVLC
jgi:hypothetical protein